MDTDNLPERTTPYFGAYQKECFLRGARSGELPPFSTHPDELQRLAHDKLTLNGWNYAQSNAGISATDQANREAFYRYKIVPRMLRDTNQRDMSIKLFGRKLNAPIGIAPIGINKIYHPEGEIPVAEVAGELNLAYALSTAGSTPIERVGEANGDGGVRYFQLYLPHEEPLAISLLERAHESGFEACMMTLDTWQLAWRHNDVQTANYAFYHGIGNDLGFSDPVFQRMLKDRGLDPLQRPEDVKEAGEYWIDRIWHGKAFDWTKAVWARDQWKRISGGRPFLLKGIQHPADAEKAKELGFDGIVVSNHAGRQVDGAVGSLDQLAEIVDRTGPTSDRWTILFDSGVRTASDIFKALALGADAVFIGRLWVWGLSIQGKVGVRHVLKSLLAEFDILMNVAGVQNVREINRDCLKVVEDYRAKGVC